MSDLSMPSERSEEQVRFTSSECDILEIREEDTQPGEVSDSFRKWLEAKYGRKAPRSANGDTNARD